MSHARPRMMGVLFLAVLTLQPAFQAADASAGSATLRVVDGDTVVLAGERLRLEGIDAPELGQTCLDDTGAAVKCGQNARQHLQRLLFSGAVSCTGDTLDGFGRRLATCFVGNRDINAQMVQDGHALAFRKYSSRYLSQEDAARQSGSGMWRGHFEHPWDYRAARWQVAGTAQAAPAGCPIKGNISKNGRIYHPPWAPAYARTRIDETKGERWFCTEAEAIAAGWRPAHGS